MLKKIEALPKQVKATIAFTLANTITQGLTLIVTPIFVRIMSTSEIGIVTNFNSWATLLGIVVNMMLYGNSYVIAINEYPNEKDQYTSCALFISMISTIVFFAIYCIAPSTFQRLLGVERNLIILMFVGFMFLPATLMWLARQRFEYKYISVLLVSVGAAICATGLSVISVLYADTFGVDKASARLYATYFINVLVGVFFTIRIYAKGKSVINKRFIKFIAVVNSPMIIHALAKNLLDVSDRVMIANLVGKSEAGIYGTLYSICTLIMVLWNAINTAILPYMFSEMNQIEIKRDSLRKVVNLLLIGFSAITLLFVLVAPEIIRIFTIKVYFTGIGIVPPVISGCFLTAVYSMFGNVLLFNKKTTSIMISTLCGGAVNVLLNYLLIPVFGYQVAAYTTIVGYYVLTIVLYFAMRRINNLTGKFLDIKFAFAISFVVLIMSILLSLLYPFWYIRYALIFISAIVTFIYRDKIISFVHIIRSK